MKLRDLKGREHKLNLSMYLPDLSKDQNKSSLHVRARLLLKAEFPFEAILEEVPVPGESLYLDFFVPNKRLVIETNGKQHYEFNSLYHRTRGDFLDGLKRDRRKREWCLFNELIIVELPYDERDEQWADRIKNC